MKADQALAMHPKARRARAAARAPRDLTSSWPSAPAAATPRRRGTARIFDAYVERLTGEYGPLDLAVRLAGLERDLGDPLKPGELTWEYGETSGATVHVDVAQACKSRHPAAQIELAAQLRARGLALREIQMQTGIPRETARRLLQA